MWRMYVSKVHSAEYVNFVKNLSIAVEGALEPVPFTPRCAYCVANVLLCVAMCCYVLLMCC